MKKLTLVLAIMLMVISSSSYSQEQTKKPKEQIKPALLVIDIQNTLFLCGLSATGCVLATWHGARNCDYKAFLVKNAIISHNAAYTKQVEEIFDAVSYDMVQLLIENAGR
jgi:nicotinamidase-related amidase